MTDPIKTICSYADCKKLIRDGELKDGKMSHGICADCLKKHYPDLSIPAKEEPMETTRYYYHRDAENKPRITVCLLKANGDIARGVAICSLSDNPCKAIGRTLAKHRALRAMKKKSNSCEMSTLKAFNALVGCSVAAVEFKAVFNPNMTVFESKLITK